MPSLDVVNDLSEILTSAFGKGVGLGWPLIPGQCFKKKTYDCFAAKVQAFMRNLAITVATGCICIVHLINGRAVPRRYPTPIARSLTRAAED
jgi:hypothetical protein